MDPAAQAAAEPYVQPLLALGYAPADLVWDAAVRIAWVPELGQDLLAYASAAAGTADPNHPAAQRPLPGGYTVGYLMYAYDLAPTGAFLFAVELVVHPDEARELLDRMRESGRGETAADGTRMVRLPRAAIEPALAAPPLPDPGTAYVTSPASAGPSPDMTAAAAPPAFCAECGTPLVPDQRFCTSCGSATG